MLHVVTVPELLDGHAVLDIECLSRATAGKLVPSSDADLDFIAHARQDIPSLTAEIRRLRAAQPSSGSHDE